MADNKGVATMAATAVDTAKSLPMSGETRGHAIKTRRLAHGIKSLRAFAEASGVSREAITAAEDGSASAATYDRLEAWLDSFEAETGADAPPRLEESPVERRRRSTDVVIVRLKNDAGEVAVEGPVEDIEALQVAAARMLRALAEAAEIERPDIPAEPDQ